MRYNIRKDCSCGDIFEILVFCFEALCTLYYGKANHDQTEAEDSYSEYCDVDLCDIDMLS